MKKTLGLIIVALLTIGLVGAYTMAYFSDTETSLDNKWTAGTLNLVNVISGTADAATSIDVYELGDGLNDKVVFSSVAPGSSGSITWTLTNTGTVDGTLTLVAVTTFDEGGDPEEPEAQAETALDAVKGLGDMLMVWVTRYDGTTTTNILGTTDVYVAMNLLAAALNLEIDETLDGGGTLVYKLYWEVPGEDVGNEIQGDTAELDITFTLDQAIV